MDLFLLGIVFESEMTAPSPGWSLRLVEMFEDDLAIALSMT
jgi:hypothetical protein